MASTSRRGRPAREPGPSRGLADALLCYRLALEEIASLAANAHTGEDGDPDEVLVQAGAIAEHALGKAAGR